MEVNGQEEGGYRVSAIYRGCANWVMSTIHCELLAVAHFPSTGFIFCGPSNIMNTYFFYKQYICIPRQETSLI